MYYEKQLKVYVIAEVEGETLYLQNVFTPREVELDKVIQAFGSRDYTSGIGICTKGSRSL